jgi:flagellin-specific chaperone FliS
MNTASSSDVAGYYDRLNISTAPKSRKLVMLHERSVELLKSSRDADPAARRQMLDKAQNILAQLEAALRIDDPVSQGLFYLYDYIYVLLERSEETAIDQATSLLSTLRDTFRELLQERPKSH